MNTGKAIKHVTLRKGDDRKVIRHLSDVDKINEKAESLGMTVEDGRKAKVSATYSDESQLVVRNGKAMSWQSKGSRYLSLP